LDIAKEFIGHKFMEVLLVVLGYLLGKLRGGDKKETRLKARLTELIP